MHWRGKWKPTPVFKPGESQGWWSLVGCRLWGRTESDMTEVTVAAAAAATKIPFPYRCWPFQISEVGLLPQKQRQGKEQQAIPASWPLLTPPSPHSHPTPTTHTVLLLGSRIGGGHQRVGIRNVSSVETTPEGLGVYLTFQLLQEAFLDFSRAGRLFLLGNSDSMDNLYHKCTPR